MTSCFEIYLNLNFIYEINEEESLHKLKLNLLTRPKPE